MKQYKIGGRAIMDCYTSFGSGPVTKTITDMITKYDPDTGDPYSVVYINEHQFDSRNGAALNPPLMYYIEPVDAESRADYQTRVSEWLVACFGEKIAGDKVERNHRFLEESLELVQACGCTQDEAYQLVDYVYNRPVGVIAQEVGGVMTTITSLCRAWGINLEQCAEDELDRVWTIMEKIRAKQAAKPKHSPLAEHTGIQKESDGSLAIRRLKESRDMLSRGIGHMKSEGEDIQETLDILRNIQVAIAELERKEKDG